jgi:hypothetical protein
MIPGSANPLLLAAAEDGAYAISRSLRFNSSDSAYLSRTPASAGNRKTWTWSGWVKRSSSTSGNMQVLLAAGPDNDDFGLVFDTDDHLHMYEWDGSFAWQKKSDQVFRDFSAWYHIVAVLDTANATTEDRARLYVNGQRIVNWNANTNPSLDFATTEINDAQQHRIGQTTATVNRYLNGYLADVHFIDGQALDPTSFGEFDTNGVWQPKQYTGTYGTNGFHLDFADNSSSAALGFDSSPNGNDWTVNNLSVAAGAGNDSLVDSPTNGTETDTGVGGEVRGNYATWNLLTKTSIHTLSNGNLDVTTTSTGNLVATIFLSSGKWYWEVNSDGYVGITGVNGVGFTGSMSVAGSDSYGYWSGGYLYSGVGGLISGGAFFFLQ